MKTFLNLAIGAWTLGGLYWVVNGDGVLDWPTRAAIWVVTLAAFGLILAGVGAHQRRQRRRRNQAHCDERGYSFTANSSIGDVFHDARLFREENVRIEQLARGKLGEVPFDVFDLSYRVTSRDSEGATRTEVISQTVASLPAPESAGVNLCVMPLRGVGGGLVRFLGLTGSMTVTPKAPADDKGAVGWFSRNYHVVWHDESGWRQAESLLTLPLLQWLRARKDLAFEITGGRVLVWRPRRLVDSAARDDLVREGVHLASALGQEKTADRPAFSIELSAPISVQGLFIRMTVSAFASWLIAGITLFGGFFAAVASGLADHAPIPTIVGLMAVTIVVWVVSGVFIFQRLSRPRRPPLTD